MQQQGLQYILGTNREGSLCTEGKLSEMASEIMPLVISGHDAL